MDQSTYTGIDQTISVIAKYSEDRSKLFFVTPDLDVCTVAYKVNTDREGADDKETDLANVDSRATAPKYVIKGKGTRAYFDLTQALLEKFSEHDPYSEIQMIQHGPEASNPSLDRQKLSPLKNIVAVLPRKLAPNPILCKTEAAFAKLVHALEERGYSVEKHICWNLDQAVSPHIPTEGINHTRPFQTAHHITQNTQISHTRISDSPPRPETPSRLATR